MITDFHTHAFPDALADRAMAALLAETDDVKAWTDGKLGSLLQSMDAAGIDRSVVCSIATKPTQYAPILEWSTKIRSNRIIPLPSIHPDDPDAADHIDEIADLGFAGIKLHPYYQNFDVDEPRMDAVYDRLQARHLMVVCHTGFDVAFPRIRRADPARVASVLRNYPDLNFVTTHLGGWQDWEQVRKHLLGKPVYMEISYSLEEMSTQEARNLILAHQRDYVLFGTDSPWQDQANALRLLEELRLPDDWNRAMLQDNASCLLDSV